MRPLVIKTTAERILTKSHHPTSSTLVTNSLSKRSHPELSNLSESTTNLAFQSIPYGSPPSLIFGTPGSITFNYTSPLFSLRILQTLPRFSTIPRPLSPSSHTSRPTPPPTLHHTTSPDPLKPFLTTQEMRERQIALKKFRKGWTMDLTILVSKKKVHKSAVVREQCKRRFKEAIRLVVMRGAYVEKGLVKFNQKEEGPNKWLVRGFSYIASGTLELYRCEISLLIEQVRKALMSLKNNAEAKLFEAKLTEIPAPPPNRNEEVDEVDKS